MIDDYFKSLTYKITTISKNSGGMISIALSSAVTFEGYIYQLRASEQVRNERLSVIATHKLLYKYDVSLTQMCAVFDGADEYKIVSINPNPANKEHHGEAMLERVE